MKFLHASFCYTGQDAVYASCAGSQYSFGSLTLLSMLVDNLLGCVGEMSIKMQRIFLLGLCECFLFGLSGAFLFTNTILISLSMTMALDFEQTASIHSHMVDQ